MQKIEYKKCRKQDLVPAARMMRTTINHLRRKSGLEINRWRIGSRPIPMLVRFWETDGDTMYCAWKNGKMVGFAGAYVNGKQWYLAWLFVHPSLQDKGVGRKLLQKVWRDGKGMTHALCTFAYNPQAVGLYSKFGMAPLCDLPWMKGDISRLKKLESTGLQVSDKPTAADVRWIHQLETKIRGYAHRDHWNVWLKNEPFQTYIFRKGGKRVGYSLITRKLVIAPLGVIDPKYMIEVMTESIKLLDKEAKERATIWCPTLNIPLYNFLIDVGFRIDEMDVFMSDTPYPDWQRYVPATLALI
jgi:GNAT superfamily N-acetyltransferase